MMDVVNNCDKSVSTAACLRMKGGRLIINGGQLPVGSAISASCPVQRKPLSRARHVDNGSLLLFSICLINFIFQVPTSCQISPFPPINSTTKTTFHLATYPHQVYRVGNQPALPLLMPVLGRPNLQPTMNPQVFSSFTLDKRTEQPLTQSPGKLLADYVTHQGQRILKNLVNTTIADLVAQSTVRIVNPNKLINGQPSAGGPFPAMGRLYTLLFPTQAPNVTSTTMESASTISSQQSDGQQKQIPGTSEFGQQEQESSTTGTEDQFSNFNHLNLNQPDEAQTQINDMRHLMSMSMGAPYDPRPRSTSMTAHMPHGSSIQMMGADDNWHRPVDGLLQDSSGLFMTSGSEQHVESNTASEDAVDPSGLRANELVDADSLGNSYGEQVQATAHNGAVDVQHASDGSEHDTQHSSLDSPDLSSLYRPLNGNEQDQQVVTEGKRGEEGSMGDPSPPNTPEEESFVAPISQQLVEAEMVHPGGSNDSSLEQAHIFAVGSEDFGDQFTQTTNLTSFEHQVAPSDDSYFTAHLPVQYETALRAPPEGHYDDYFKLLSSSAGSGTHSDNDLQSQLAIHSQEDSTAFFTNSNDQLGNRSARHFVHDNKLETDFSGYIPARRPRDHSGINYDGPNGTGGIQYEVQHIYERVPYINQSTTHVPLNESALMNSLSQSNPSRVRGAIGGSYEQFQHRNSTTPSDDNLQVIIAKTNYGRNPLSPEKVINYTSENHNFTWSGKSPRNHFVNKDMNETPVEPVETPPSSRFGGSPDANYLRTTSTKTTAGVDVSLPAPISPPPPTPASQDQHYIVGNLASGSIRSPLPSSGHFESLHLSGQVPPQLVQIVELGPKGQQSEAAMSPPMPLNDAIQTIVSRQQSAARQDQQQQQRPSGGGERKRARGQSKRERRLRGQKPHRLSSSNKAVAFNGQPQRPQVTQVHLEQQNEPTTTTASASSTDGSGGDGGGQQTGDTELKGAGKMKQLREHPPDKNELMNELLSALDRVKVAIYKLQPLTAKMNAIYRKSVTSNTRDTIMDKHKGTYAKRYPPGDYDNNYDRIQPTDIAQNEIASRSQEQGQSHQASSLIPDRSAEPHQVSSTVSTTEVTDEPIPRVGAELEASDSDTRAVYMRSPLAPNMSGSANTSSTREAPRRWRRRVTSLELDSLNASESRVIATGIGRRLGDRNLATLDEKLSVELDPQQNQLSDLSQPQDLLSADTNSFVGAPLFGYRITIYQKPVDQLGTDGSKFAYRVDGLTEPVAGGSEPQQDVELMTTSESSVVDFKSAEDGSSVDKSSGSHKKAAAGGKRDNNWKKSDSGKKEDGKESKHQKEFKKIKHNKGLTSKERKSMHRDKNVKAHDRGAAKEKALKERTQIEFFEREQIVDDEFEKAKKSNANVNWQTGRDSKKAIQAADLADTVSSGGSHYVNHRGPNEKSHTVGSEQTSGKKSSKTEKRHLEAKGKKFKGWREKGYKIITETEFIDRGSLHDSAYRKRDKGSALQQKYRRQQLASEGQHGSSIEHHKKLHKKEQRRNNAQQTKETRAKDEMNQDKAHNKKSSKKASGGGSPDSNDIEQSGSNKLERTRQKLHPGLLSTGSTTFRPAVSQNDEPPPKALLRLLNSAHHEQYPDEIQVLTGSRAQGRKTSNLSLNQTNAYELEPSERRADVVSSHGTTGKLKSSRNTTQKSSEKGNNATLLDVVDNSIVRQPNKTKIGTNDLSQDDEPTVRYSNGSISLSKIANSLAHYSSYLTKAQPKAASRDTSTTTAPTISTNTNIEKQLDSSRLPEHYQINSNQSSRHQQQLPSLSNSQNYNQNHNQNQNQHYNFDLMEYKRQLQMRANQQLNPYIPYEHNPSSMNHAFHDKQSMAHFGVNPDQAEAAAQILSLVQRAAIKEPPIQTIPAHYMDFLGPLHRTALLAPAGVAPFGHIYPGAQQGLTQPMAFMPNPIAYGMNPFRQSQFQDYDHQHQT